MAHGSCESTPALLPWFSGFTNLFPLMVWGCEGMVTGNTPGASALFCVTWSPSGTLIRPTFGLQIL